MSKLAEFNLREKTISELQKYRKESDWINYKNQDEISLDFLNSMIRAKLKGCRRIGDFSREMSYYCDSPDNMEILKSYFKKAIPFIKKDSSIDSFYREIKNINDFSIQKIMMDLCESNDDCELVDSMIVYSAVLN